MSLENLAQARFNMIEQQIRTWNVLDAGVLELLSTVKREDFCPLEHKSLAFGDLEIPLPGGQCMLSPRIDARMLQDLAIKPTDKVLEIGAGSGYMAALLAHRAQHVVSLDLSPELVAMARANLHAAGIRNAEVRCADGSQLPLTEGPFDVIVLSGSVTQVPQDLLQRLSMGGRFGAIVGNLPMMQATFVTRVSATEYSTKQPWDAVVPRLQNFAEPSRFKF